MPPRPPLADHPVFSRSLADLLDLGPGGGPFDSGLTAWRHRIARVPLWALDDDDLLLLVGEGRGLPHTVALALHRLAEDPLRSGAHPPGTMWRALASVPDGCWAAEPGLRAGLARAVAVLRAAPVPSDVLDDAEALTALVAASGPA